MAKCFDFFGVVRLRITITCEEMCGELQILLPTATTLSRGCTPGAIGQFATVRSLHPASLQMQKAGLRSGLLLIPNERRVYGANSLILVAQFPRDVRVPPQEPIAPVRYCVNVQV